MRRVGALLCLLLGAAWAHPATIQERSVTLRIGAEGYIREERLAVRIEDGADADDWRDYGIPVPAGADLEEVEAAVTRADGHRVRRVRRRDVRWHESVGGVLYTSARVAALPLGNLHEGDTLSIRHTVRCSGLLQGAVVPLALDNHQERLTVEVTGRPVRWTVTGGGVGEEVQRSGGGLHLSAQSVSPWQAPDHAPYWYRRPPRLLVTWGAGDSWTSVGRWYQRLVDDPPEPSSEIATHAEHLCPPGTGPAAGLERLARFVQHQVRYVAVEIDDGGWKPSPAGQVLERRWGDCKDKAHLLARLLAAVGIPSHLVLVRSGGSGRLDERFPAPLWFNHCILAVPAAAVGLGERAGTVEGLLILDPTQDHGSPLWLGPECRGRPALLVDGERSRLIELPPSPADEGKWVTVSGVVGPAGTFGGSVHLVLRGGAAIPWLEGFATEAKDRIVESIVAMATALLPGARVGSVSWNGTDEGDPPTAELEASINLPRFVRGRPGHRWLRLPRLTSLPPLSVVDERPVPVALHPGTTSLRLVCSLPTGWCPPRELGGTVETPLGSHLFEVRASNGGSGLTAERTTTVVSPRALPAELADLETLIRAEGRAGATRVRLRCTQPAQGSTRNATPSGG